MDPTLQIDLDNTSLLLEERFRAFDRQLQVRDGLTPSPLTKLDPTSCVHECGISLQLLVVVNQVRKLLRVKPQRPNAFAFLRRSFRFSYPLKRLRFLQTQ